MVCPTASSLIVLPVWTGPDLICAVVFTILLCLAVECWRLVVQCVVLVLIDESERIHAPAVHKRGNCT